MSETRRLVWWTAAAEGDLAELVTFVAAGSVPGARKLLSRLRQRAASLELMSERGRIVPELAAFGIRSYRELIVKPYRLVYRVTGEDVVVLALFDSRRDLDDLLLDRLLR